MNGPDSLETFTTMAEQDDRKRPAIDYDGGQDGSSAGAEARENDRKRNKASNQRLEGLVWIDPSYMHLLAGMPQQKDRRRYGPPRNEGNPWVLYRTGWWGAHGRDTIPRFTGAFQRWKWSYEPMRNVNIVLEWERYQQEETQRKDPPAWMRMHPCHSRDNGVAIIKERYLWFCNWSVCLPIGLMQKYTERKRCPWISGPQKWATVLNEDLPTTMVRGVDGKSTTRELKSDIYDLADAQRYFHYNPGDTEARKRAEQAYDVVELWNPDYQLSIGELSDRLGFNLEHGRDAFKAYVKEENLKHRELRNATICFQRLNKLAIDVNRFHFAELALATSYPALTVHPLDDWIVYLTIHFHPQCIRLLKYLDKPLMLHCKPEFYTGEY